MRKAFYPRQSCNPWPSSAIRTWMASGAFHRPFWVYEFRVSASTFGVPHSASGWFSTQQSEIRNLKLSEAWNLGGQDGNVPRAASVINIKNRPEWPLDKVSFSQLIAGERVTNQLTTISKTDESEILWISSRTERSGCAPSEIAALLSNVLPKIYALTKGPAEPSRPRPLHEVASESGDQRTKFLS
jgi:hypothetical protein